MNDTAKMRAIVAEWQAMMFSPDPITKWDLAIVGGQAVGLLQRLLAEGEPITPPPAARPGAANPGPGVTLRSLPPVRAWEYTPEMHGQSA